MNTCKVCVIGAGYIGLPTAALLASSGFNVIVCDIKEEVVNNINKGTTHILEKGLKDLVARTVASGKLRANSEVVEAEVYIIAVPTPFHKNLANIKTGSPKPDLSYIVNASKNISEVAPENALIVLESTVPVGTTKFISDLIMNQTGLSKSLKFAHCPERVIPGNILYELEHNDRIVGGLSHAATERAAAFYRSFVSGKVHKTTAAIAEMSKLTENAYRDVNIAFANELSMIVPSDIDVREVIRLANFHPRVNILEPGCGVGGHCISVDPWFIVDQTNGEAQLIHTARNVNIKKEAWVIEKIQNEHKKYPGLPIICYGLTYKPDVDDLRESPALNIVYELIAKKFDVYVVEPNVRNIVGINLIDVEAVKSLKALHVMLVKHKQFKKVLTFNGSYVDFSA